MPPIARVDCRQPATPDVHIVLPNTYVEWLTYGPAGLVEVLDALTLERQYRKLEHECFSQYFDRVLGNTP